MWIGLLLRRENCQNCTKEGRIEKKGDSTDIPLGKEETLFFNEGNEKLTNFERVEGDLDSCFIIL